jgi:hypothetical protein
MFKRNGKYYLMWSEGGWTGPNYSVYPAVARGSGHNAVINVPGTDIWYILYHRRPPSETDGNHRQVAYDRMVFNADGTIAPVTMRVRDDFADRNALGWKIHGGGWSVQSGQFAATNSLGGKALLDTNFGDVVQDTTVTVTSGAGDAGVVFRVTQPAVGADSYRGYYAGISTRGRVLLGRAANSWTLLKDAALPVVPGQRYHLRVTASGADLRVYVDDMTTPKLTATDATHSSGANGVRVYNAAATFDDVAVRHPGR